MNTFSNIMLTFAVIMNVFTLRSFLVSRCYTRAARYVLNHKNIAELHTKYMVEFKYNATVCNPLKWTYAQMFPGLEDEE